MWDPKIARTLTRKFSATALDSAVQIGKAVVLTVPSGTGTQTAGCLGIRTQRATMPEAVTALTKTKGRSVLGISRKGGSSLNKTSL